MEDNQVAADLRARLAETIGQERYALWFGSQTEFRLTDGCLTVVTASRFTRDWLRRNFAEGVREVCATVTGGEMRVEFDVDESISPAKEHAKESSVPKAAAQTNSAPPTHSDSTAKAAQLAKTHVNGADPHRHRKLATRKEPTLAELVVGSSNEYAIRAAEVTISPAREAAAWPP
jgi:chromosomal replication initiation ATPase DnaA